MKTFLEVEGKMGPIPASQFRPPLPDTNPNVRKDTEKRKRAVPKRFRPSAAPKPTAACLPATVSKGPANVQPKTDVPENRPPPLENVPVCQSTLWPGTGKVSGNLLKTEIGYPLQITLTMKIRMQLVSLVQGPL